MEKGKWRAEEKGKRGDKRLKVRLTVLEQMNGRMLCSDYGGQQWSC